MAGFALALTVDGPEHVTMGLLLPMRVECHGLQALLMFCSKACTQFAWLGQMPMNKRGLLLIEAKQRQLNNHLMAGHLVGHKCTLPLFENLPSEADASFEARFCPAMPDNCALP